MRREEKAIFILACYCQALLLNALTIPMLDGINQIVWIAWNIWMWIFAPIIILRAKDIDYITFFMLTLSEPETELFLLNLSKLDEENSIIKFSKMKYQKLSYILFGATETYRNNIYIDPNPKA